MSLKPASLLEDKFRDSTMSDSNRSDGSLVHRLLFLNRCKRGGSLDDFPDKYKQKFTQVCHTAKHV